MGGSVVHARRPAPQRSSTAFVRRTSGTSADKTSAEVQFSGKRSAAGFCPSFPRRIVNCGSELKGVRRASLSKWSWMRQVPPRSSWVSNMSGPRPWSWALTHRASEQKNSPAWGQAADRAGVFAVGLSGVTQHAADACLPGGHQRSLVFVDA